ncbi:copper-translocating P-type ATPase [Ferrimonas pelagia]|uniref:Copper-exporting P-type ATPase n=1 Tax=Ferrimonas pelagia TaxID=1177826 RepID=A0ABP9EWD7_9GAMM
MSLALPLAGLNCQRCVNKVTVALKERCDVEHFTVSKTEMVLHGTISRVQAIELIEALGFSVPMVDSIERHYPLYGLNCGRCVKKVEAVLEQRSDIEQFSVNKEAMTVQGAIDGDALRQLILDLGFDTQPPADPSDTTPTRSKAPLTPQSNDSAAVKPSNKAKPKRGKTHHLLVSGMTCASCVRAVENAASSAQGVSHVSVSLAEQSLQVQCDEITPVLHALQQAGYPAEPMRSEQERRDKLEQKTQSQHRRFLRDTAIALGLGIPMMAYGLLGGSMMITSPALQLGWGIAGLLTLAMLMSAGRMFFTNAWSALRRGSATMDTLVALGTGSAWLYSMLVVISPGFFPEAARHVYFEASAMIIGLISLGHAIETKAKRRASRALEKLLDLQPPEAVVMVDQQEVITPLAEIEPGMRVRLKPGMKVALDGLVVEGHSYLDEAMLTGEPIAVAKSVGDRVSAGTQNQQGALDYEVTATGSDTLLAHIVDMVRTAQNSKPALARLVDRIAAVFVPVVVAIAVLTAVVWGLFGPEPKISYMLVTTTTVLIIACPCALGLATPMSVNIGVGRAAELGILVRDAAALQLTNAIDTVVLDKTGTLTQGQPKLTHSHIYQGDKAILLNAVAAIEAHSEHPLAMALRPYLTAPSKPSAFQAHPGKGISASLDGQQWQIGNASLMPTLSTAPQAHADAISEQGATPIFVAREGEVIAVLGVSDPLREDSAAAVAQLQAMGKRVIMMTGDTEKTARAIAKQANIDDVYAGVQPGEKAALVEQLSAEGRNVLMIGDGINDAPALAAAHVSMAMGSGSDIAKESAHFTLIRHSLMSAVDALQLSRATLKNMHQNLLGAFIYNSIGIPVAAGVLYPLTGTLLNPMIAGAAMALSSITVVSNASRLRLFKARK